MAGFTALALAVRVGYVLVVTRHLHTGVYDAWWYQFQALNLVSGHFFPVPFSTVPDAAHPPLTSMVVAPATYIWGLPPGATPQELTMAVLGTATIPAVGLLGRRVVGPRVGLIAAALAALYPNMVMPSGIVMSEALTMLLVALILLAAYRVLLSPTWPACLLLGAACGVEMLVRAETVLLVPLLLLPAIVASRGLSWQRRGARLGVAVLAAAVVVAPWVGRNLASFRSVTLISTGEGPVLAGANCPATYYGPGIGTWDIGCSLAVKPSADQSVESARQSAAGERYLRAHTGRLPLVAAVRLGRTWGLYQPVSGFDLDLAEGRPDNAALAGLACYYLMVPLAVVGIVSLRRRGLRQWPLLVPVLAVSLVVVASYGMVRFRAEAEVSLVVLAAVGIDATIGYLDRRRQRVGSGGTAQR